MTSPLSSESTQGTFTMSYTVEIGERLTSDYLGLMKDVKIVSGVNSNTNYSAEIRLGMKYAGASSDFTESTLMQIDLATEFAGRVVEDASIQIYSGTVQASNGVNLKAMTQAFDFATVTQNTYDGVNPWPGGSFWAANGTWPVLFSFTTSQSTPYFITLSHVNLPPYLQNVIDGVDGAPAGTLSISFVSNHNLNLYPHSSRNVNVGNRPILTIQFAGSPPVPPPSGLNSPTWSSYYQNLLRRRNRYVG